MAEIADATRPLIEGFFQRYPDEVASALAELPVEEVLPLLERESGRVAAQVFVHLNPDAAIRLAEEMDEELFRRLFAEIDPVHGAALLARLGGELRDARLRQLPRSTARELRELMTYPADSAGQLMDPRVTTFHPDETVEKALARIREHRERRIVDLCLVDAQRHLVAVIPLQEVAVAESDERLENLVHRRLVSVQGTALREEVVSLLEEQKLASLPVVDFEGRLLGIIRYDALISAAQKDASEAIQAMVGAGREERALSKTSFAIRKRLPWLQINLATAFLAASVVGLFEDTIARFTALAVLLPVVAGQSGNTGSQALAVTMRGLALREIRMRDWFRVATKEVLTAFVNGCAVALTTALVVYLWSGSIGMPLVLGIAMVFSMVIAGLAGALIPVILTAFGQDPAQSSSIILTTVTDVVGFMSFLGLATLLSGTFNLAL